MVTEADQFPFNHCSLHAPSDWPINPDFSSMTKHLLVDLENVQPSAEAVADWMGTKGKTWIFHGPHQRKLLPSFQDIGDGVTLIPISRAGANSLDFHLVFYLGYLAAANPKSEFAILARDKGYDPAIAHARILEINVKRIKTLASKGAARSQSGNGTAKAVKPPAKFAANAASDKKAAAKSAPRTMNSSSENKPARKGITTAKDKMVAPTPKLAQVAKATVEIAPSPPKTKAQSVVPKPLDALFAKPAPTKKLTSKLVIAIYRDVLADLRERNRPRSLAALERRIQSRIGIEPAPEKVRAVVERLQTVDAIRVAGNRLVYFPEEAIGIKGGA